MEKEIKEIEERITKLENDVIVLKEFIEGLMDEFRKFNQLADQIDDITNKVSEAVHVLSNTDITE